MDLVSSIKHYIIKSKKAFKIATESKTFKDYKPFKYISKKYKISRPALKKRIDKIPDFEKDFVKRNKTGQWFISPKGIKLITYQKTNSTSNFRSRKIGHYKEKQATKNQLINWFGNLTVSNKALVAANKSLTKSNQDLTAANAELTAQGNEKDETIDKLRKELEAQHGAKSSELKKIIAKDAKVIANDKHLQKELSHHGFIWKIFH